MKEILENLHNWKKKKEDKIFIADILTRADYFSMQDLVKDDSESYHLYLALEEKNKEEKDIPQYKLIIYAISKNKDNVEYISKNLEKHKKFITKFDVENENIAENTMIPTLEAKKRKSRWSSEIKDWVNRNEVFDVFDIPSENFRFKNALITISGHFGIKDHPKQKVGMSEVNESLPDLIIAYSSPLASAYFDMAKLSPPFRNQAHEKEFALLNFKLLLD